MSELDLKALEAAATRKAPLFICEHKKRDDEDCLPCEVRYEAEQIAAAEERLKTSKALLEEKRARLAAQEKNDEASLGVGLSSRKTSPRF
mgnify:CR=1 FL=1